MQSIKLTGKNNFLWMTVPIKVKRKLPDYGINHIFYPQEEITYDIRRSHSTCY